MQRHFAGSHSTGNWPSNRPEPEAFGRFEADRRNELGTTPQQRLLREDDQEVMACRQRYLVIRASSSSWQAHNEPGEATRRPSHRRR